MVTDSGPAEERLLSGHSGRMLAVVAASSATVFAGQLVIPPLLPRIVDTLGISPSKAGIALSVMWALVALSRFPGGRLADGLSRKTVLVASFAVSIVALAVLATATTYPAFVVGVALLGVGAGLYMPAAVTLLSRTFVARRSRAFGVHEVSINLGGVLAGVLAVVTLAVAPWQVAFLPVIVALGVVVLLTHRWSHEPYSFARVNFDLAGTGRRLLGNRRALAMLVAFALLSFTWQGLSNFLPTFLQVEKGFAPALAGNAFTGLFVVGIATNLLVTPFGDRLGHARMAAAAVGAAAAGIGILVVSGSVPATLAGIALFGLGSASFWPLMISALMGLLPDGTSGGDYGALSTVFMAIGSLGPAYVGFVAERLDYTAAFTGLVVCLLGGFMVATWLARTHRS